MRLAERLSSLAGSGCKERDVSKNRHGGPVNLIAWFGLTVTRARPRFGLYPSPNGSYIPGTGMLFRRR